MENNPQEDTEESPLSGWSKDEKFYLLQGIRAYGSYDIEQIQEYITTKSAEQISAAIEHYKQKALKHPIFDKQQTDKVKDSKTPRVPLASWAKLLTKTMDYSELRTETSTALRMIADLEPIPPPSCTDNIDFRNIYHEMANAMEGKPLTHNQSTSAIFNKCVIETALSSKAFISNRAFKYLIKCIDGSEKDMNVFLRPTDDHELLILRNLASQRNYNPLNIPEDYLKPTQETKWDGMDVDFGPERPTNPTK